jgi:hypothetical protein
MASFRHFKSPFCQTVLSALDATETNQIFLGTIQDAHLERILYSAPLRRTVIFDATSWPYPNYHGLYVPDGHADPNAFPPEMLLRHPTHLEEVRIDSEPLRPGESEYVSVTTDVISFTKCVFAHELGHHLYLSFPDIIGPLVTATHPRAKPISNYASFNPEEYFCETLAAHTYYPKSLNDYDPLGYTLIQEVLEAVNAEVN